jgi:hypothetical protein
MPPTHAAVEHCMPKMPCFGATLTMAAGAAYAAQERRYAAGVRRFDFDSGLAPYNLAQWPQWQQLSGHLTQGIISKLLPVSATRARRPGTCTPCTGMCGLPAGAQHLPCCQPGLGRGGSCWCRS